MEKYKLLIADDSKTIRVIYGDILDDSKFEIKFAEDGEKAVQTYIVWKPDIILLDITMPVKSGYDALQAIRDNEKGGNQTTVIMATSLHDKETILKCAKLGIQGYIVKDGSWYEEDITGKILSAHDANKPAA